MIFEKERVLINRKRLAAGPGLAQEWLPPVCSQRGKSQK